MGSAVQTWGTCSKPVNMIAADRVKKNHFSIQVCQTLTWIWGGFFYRCEKDEDLFPAEGHKGATGQSPECLLGMRIDKSPVLTISQWESNESSQLLIKTSFVGGNWWIRQSTADTSRICQNFYIFYYFFAPIHTWSVSFFGNIQKNDWMKVNTHSKAVGKTDYLTCTVYWLNIK